MNRQTCKTHTHSVMWNCVQDRAPTSQRSRCLRHPTTATWHDPGFLANPKPLGCHDPLPCKKSASMASTENTHGLPAVSLATSPPGVELGTAGGREAELEPAMPDPVAFMRASALPLATTATSRASLPAAILSSLSESPGRVGGATAGNAWVHTPHTTHHGCTGSRTQHVAGCPKKQPQDVHGTQQPASLSAFFKHFQAEAARDRAGGGKSSLGHQGTKSVFPHSLSD